MFVFINTTDRDALLVASINSLTSLLSGFVVFTLLGYMAYKRNVLVLDVIKDGKSKTYIFLTEKVWIFQFLTNVTWKTLARLFILQWGNVRKHCELIAKFNDVMRLLTDFTWNVSKT